MTTLGLLPEDLLLFVVHFADVNSALSLVQVSTRSRDLGVAGLPPIADLQAPVCARQYEGVLVGVGAENGPHSAGTHSGPFPNHADRPAVGCSPSLCSRVKVSRIRGGHYYPS